jgi:hypothetical protein
MVGRVWACLCQGAEEMEDMEIAGFWPWLVACDASETFTASCPLKEFTPIIPAWTEVLARAGSWLWFRGTLYRASAMSAALFRIISWKVKGTSLLATPTHPPNNLCVPLLWHILCSEPYVVNCSPFNIPADTSISQASLSWPHLSWGNWGYERQSFNSKTFISLKAELRPRMPLLDTEAYCCQYITVLWDFPSPAHIGTQSRQFMSPGATQRNQSLGISITALWVVNAGGVGEEWDWLDSVSQAASVPCIPLCMRHEWYTTGTSLYILGEEIKSFLPSQDSFLNGALFQKGKWFNRKGNRSFIKARKSEQLCDMSHLRSCVLNAWVLLS